MAHDDLQRALTEERERIADALHDDVLPLLAVLRQDLLEEVAMLAAVRQVDDAIAALRALIVAEHPLAAARDDLESALTAVAGPVCSRAGLRLTLSVGEVEALEPHRDLVLAAVRELVENVARHARARTVQVSFHADDGGAVLQVVDDGDGIDTALARKRERAGHLGLRRLRRRAAAAGAELRIDSRPGHTEVTLAFRRPRAT